MRTGVVVQQRARMAPDMRAVLNVHPPNHYFPFGWWAGLIHEFQSWVSDRIRRGNPKLPISFVQPLAISMFKLFSHGAFTIHVVLDA